MNKDKIQARIDKIEKEVKDGTINNPSYVMEALKEIWAEIIETCTCKTGAPLYCDDTPTTKDEAGSVQSFPMPDDSECKEKSFFWSLFTTIREEYYIHEWLFVFITLCNILIFMVSLR